MHRIGCGSWYSNLKRHLLFIKQSSVFGVQFVFTMLLEWAKIKINFDKPSYPQFNPVWIYRSGPFGSLAFVTALFWVKTARVKMSTARVKNKVHKSDFNSANFSPWGKFQLPLSHILDQIIPTEDPNSKKSQTCTVKILKFTFMPILVKF